MKSEVCLLLCGEDCSFWDDAKEVTPNNGRDELENAMAIAML